MLKRITVLFLCLALALPAAAAAPVSPALNIIADGVKMVKSGLAGSDVYFTPADFERCTSLESVRSITVKTLPSVFDGILCVGNIPLREGDRITRKDISKLRFIPVSGNEQADFTFTVENSSFDYPISCTLCMLDKLNFSPAVCIQENDVLTISTQENIATFGVMKAVDPENDAITYFITTPPKHGSISVSAGNDGAYLYSPEPSYTGKDYFEYIACDSYGNYSDIGRITVNVVKAASDVFYSDLAGHWAHNAAIKMTANEIMTGTLSGNELIFSPDTPVTRGEFLKMAMLACGHSVAATVNSTPFHDTDDIPLSVRGYAATALENGYINGVECDGKLCFLPQREITRAEAAVIITNMTGAVAPVNKTLFSDAGSVPAWASDSLACLVAEGIISGIGEGNIAPLATLTRAQCAQMLCRIIETD